jgi:hypothetical protein
MAIVDSLQKISDTVWELPPSYKEGMRVPARIIATEKLVREMDEAVYQQISNVATLPGITRYALCMPDGHSGYGFPIGGVAAMDVHEGGVISPGGIGFDINCGMRLVTTNLTLEDVQPRLKEIVDRLFQRVPAGVGTHGFLKLSHNEFRDLVEQGARWCVERDLGWQAVCVVDTVTTLGATFSTSGAKVVIIPSRVCWGCCAVTGDRLVCTPNTASINSAHDLRIPLCIMALPAKENRTHIQYRLFF